MSRMTLVNDGVPALLLLLLVLLAVSLLAVIRLPRWAGPSPDEDHQPVLDEPALESSVFAQPRGRAEPEPAPARAKHAHARAGHSRPAAAAPSARPRGPQAAAAPAPFVPAGATGQADQGGQADFAARRGPGPEPWRGTARAPKVSGRPPWEPAPRPPGQMTS